MQYLENQFQHQMKPRVKTTHRHHRALLLLMLGSAAIISSLRGCLSMARTHDSQSDFNDSILWSSICSFTWYNQRMDPTLHCRMGSNVLLENIKSKFKIFKFFSITSRYPVHDHEIWQAYLPSRIFEPCQVFDMSTIFLFCINYTSCSCSWFFEPRLPCTLSCFLL